jgi:putative transposase
MRYRRAKIKGGTYFFTVNLADRSSTLLIDKIDILSKIEQKSREQTP